MKKRFSNSRSIKITRLPHQSKILVEKSTGIDMPSKAFKFFGR